ncbi:hypothetical protein AD940_14225 [Gluconobacter thailandicus]|nr:hypothetical protein AD940_14225 [Gluconobacter thailandicus]
MLEQVEFKLPGDDDCRIYNYIHYRKDISEKHRRFVFCKELIHILDPACYRTNNDVDVEELTIGMTTSNPIEEASPQAIHDRRSVVLAAAVFIPPSIREKLLPALETGEKTIQDISDFLKIPEEIVGSVFSKSWLTTFKYHMDRLNKDLDGEDEYDEPNSHNVVSEDVSSDA